MIGMPGMPEMVIIAAIAMLIFGPKQLPRLGKSMGETIKAFKGAGKELRSLHEDGDDDNE